jgi:beta-glucanase (GH16 family)
MGSLVGTPGEFDYGLLAINELWDNFDGAPGTTIDNRLWLLDSINQGGNQNYDSSTNRVYLDGQSNVVLKATGRGGTYTATTASNPYISQPGDTWASIASTWQASVGDLRTYVNKSIGDTFPTGTAITIPNISGRFTSRQRFNMQYGWCAFRAKLPLTQGTMGKSWFPALWLLHINYNIAGVPYGEIDMMEEFGNSSTYNTHIYTSGSTLASVKPVPANQSGGNAGEGFHTYWMLWQPDSIQIGVDDLSMGSWTAASLGNPAAWAGVQQPFYFIANFAINPGYLPAPLATDFPAQMLIDWVWYKPLSAL